MDLRDSSIPFALVRFKARMRGFNFYMDILVNCLGGLSSSFGVGSVPSVESLRFGYTRVKGYRSSLL